MVAKKNLLVTIISGLLIAAGWLLSKAGAQMFSDVLMIIAAIVAGYRIAQSALYALRFRVLGINALVTIAAVGAILIGEYWEAAVVTFLFALGSYLEARTLDRTRDALRKLMELAPLVARVRRDGQELELPVEEVREGDLVLIKSGEKIPVDGKVLDGNASVNQAPITGESMPVEKAKGDQVFSGTINEEGYLEVITERAGHESTFAKIIQLVEEAQQEKAKSQQILERFASYYTPGIIVISALVFVITKDPVMALTLLVIACPGALVIATPVSIVAGIGNAARHGMLIKGGEHLEKAGSIQIMVFDKTGTLTQGKPQVTGVWSEDVSRSELLLKAAAVEAFSEHPLALPILDEARKVGDIPGARNFQVFPGRGIRADVEGKSVVVGNRKMLQEMGLALDTTVEEKLQSEENSGRTGVIVAEEGDIVGLIFIEDVPREDALDLVPRLKRAGIQRVVMLTGDNQRTAHSIAKRLGIDEVYAETLPEDKVSVIEKLRQSGKVVAMVGDGINDAPAMARADVGIAMGAAGTDVAMETADLVLMADDLSKLPYAIGLSRSTLRNIKQNVTFAIAVVLVLLLGVIGRVVILSSGMLVHEASVLLVTLNAMRLLGYKAPG